MPASEDYLRQSIDLSRQLGVDRVLVRGLHSMATGIYTPRGEFALALACDEEALKLAHARGLPELVWGPLVTMSWVCWLTGQRERTLTLLEALHTVAVPGTLAAGYRIFIQAGLALEDGALDTARALLAEMRSLAEASGIVELGFFARLGLSRLCRTAGDAPTARAWAADALVLVERTGYRHLQGMALIERGRATWTLDEGAQAEADFRAALAVLGPLRANFDMARAALLLAALLHTQRAAGAAAAWHAAVSRIVNGGYAFLLEQERALAFPLLAAHLSSATPESRAISGRLLAQLAAVPPPALRVFTLGRFEVWQGARQIDPRALRQRRAGELLALLATTPGHALAWEQVIEALWPDKDPETVQTPFHHATSTLRRALEPDLPEKFPSRYLDVAGGRVSLTLPAGSWLDFEVFEIHYRAGEWDAALALYAGDVLPEFLYADWALLLRQRCAQEYQHALLAQARARFAAGDAWGALQTCRRLLALEPWQEQAVLLGMQASLALDDRAGAMRLYRTLEDTLRAELNAEPQAELQALYRDLRRSSPPR